MFRERVTDQGGGHVWRTVYADVTGAQPGDTVTLGTDHVWRKGHITGDGPDLTAEVAALRTELDALKTRVTTTFFKNPDTAAYEQVDVVHYDPATGDVEGHVEGMP